MRRPFFHHELPDSGQVPHSALDLRPPALWQHITHRTLTAAAATLTLDNLPTGFDLWRLHVYALSDDAGESDDYTMQLNDDTGNNYDHIAHVAVGSGASAGVGAVAQTSLAIGTCEAGAARAATISPNVIEFHRPTETSWEKVGSYNCIRFGNRSATSDIRHEQGWWTWRSAAAITKITLTMTTGDFGARTHLALWGMQLT